MMMWAGRPRLSLVCCRENYKNILSERVKSVFGLSAKIHQTVWIKENPSYLSVFSVMRRSKKTRQSDKVFGTLYKLAIDIPQSGGARDHCK